jgi:hypothetical protein
MQTNLIAGVRSESSKTAKIVLPGEGAKVTLHASQKCELRSASSGVECWGKGEWIVAIYGVTRTKHICCRVHCRQLVRQAKSNGLDVFSERIGLDW